ncbi:MAG: hypothetical protein ACFFC7_01485 [Candidatus Hermodarchaeota archaeon]
MENKLISLLAEALQARRSSSFKASSLINELEKLQSYYRGYRGELEREFGALSNTQFFCVIIGERLRFGDLSYLFEICFTSLSKYSTDIKRIMNTVLLFKAPQDIVSALLQGATYLISAEIVQIGEIFANEEKLLLQLPDSAVVDFLEKLIMGDKDLETVFIEKGIIARWSHLRKERLYVPSPFSALAPLLRKKEILNEFKALMSARMAYLFSRGYGASIDFISVLEQLFSAIKEEPTQYKSVCRAIAQDIYERMKKRNLRSSIEQLITQGFTDLRGFSSFSVLANLITEYYKLSSVSWKETRNFVMETTKGALRRSIKPQIQKDLLLLQKIDFGASEKPTGTTQEFEGLLRAYYEQHRHKKDLQASDSSSELIFEYKKEISDLENKINLISRSYKHLIANLNLNTGEQSLSEFIAKSAIFIAYESASKADESTQQTIVRLIFQFLLEEVKALRAIDPKPDLKEFLVKEIKLMSQIIRLKENFVQQIHFYPRKNREVASLGWAVKCIKELLKDWITIPRDYLYKKYPSFKSPDFVSASQRGDLRNFFLLAALGQLETESLSEAYKKVYEAFPSSIPPRSNSLLIDSAILVDYLTRSDTKNILRD